MTDNFIGGKDVPEAIRKAVKLATADLGHHDLSASIPQIWHTIGIILTEDAKADALAKSIVDYAKVDARPAVVRIDAEHLIVGFISPETLQR